MKNKGTLSQFSKFLVTLRENAGFKTQDAAVFAMASLSKKGDRPLSKSMLSLLERGEIKTIKPETLQLLARAYEVPYKMLAQQWFSDRYGVELDLSASNSFVKHAEKEFCVLKGPKGTEIEDISIISISKLVQEQGRLPKGSQVGVAALSFLDDNVIFFDMVVKNIARGVKYYYLMPEEEYLSYKTFLTRIIERLPRLANKLDGKLTHFIPRVPHDRVANYVVHVKPNGNLAGYVGLLGIQRPQYFQVAALHLTWRLFESFRWAVTVAEDSMMKKSVADLHLRVGKTEFSTKGRSLSPFVV